MSRAGIPGCHLLLSYHDFCLPSKMHQTPWDRSVSAQMYGTEGCKFPDFGGSYLIERIRHKNRCLSENSPEGPWLPVLTFLQSSAPRPFMAFSKSIQRPPLCPTSMGSPPPSFRRAPYTWTLHSTSATFWSMLQLSVQTVMPISDRPLGAPGCQADCEVSGKTQKVFAQCLLGAPALHSLPADIPMLAAVPGCWDLTLRLHWCQTEGSWGGLPGSPKTTTTWAKEPFCQQLSGCFVGSSLCQDAPFSANEQLKCADEEKSGECKPWSWNNVSNTGGCLSGKTARPKESFQMPSFVLKLPVRLSPLVFLFAFKTITIKHLWNIEARGSTSMSYSSPKASKKEDGMLTV